MIANTDKLGEKRMVGMLQILTDLLGVYLVVKGIEVLQIGLASNRSNRVGLIVIGVLTVIGCTWSAWSFVNMQDLQAASVASSGHSAQ